MTFKLGVVMDPIATITIKKDTTFAMLLAAQARGWELYYFEQADLYALGDQASGRARRLSVQDDQYGWFTFHGEQELPLAELDAILMRKDPPFDMEYLYSTHLLDMAQRQGARVFNRPSAVRKHNEKLAILEFAQFCAPTLVSREPSRLRAFHAEHGDVIFKPLDGMGGAGIFRVREDGMNLGATVEMLTRDGAVTIMAQRYIPAISEGDKRILLIGGKPVPHALARIPQAGEVRGNLAAGGRGEARVLTARDRDIAETLAPLLAARGLLLVGLDVIGAHLTEINVTSPTCFREIMQQTGFDVAGMFIDALETAASLTQTNEEQA